MFSKGKTCKPEFIIDDDTMLYLFGGHMPVTVNAKNPLFQEFLRNRAYATPSP
jgi:hypothetical protein